MVGQPVVCNLCGLTTTFPLMDQAGKPYCCPACLEVSGLLTAEKGGRTAAADPVWPAKVGQSVSSATLCLAGMWCPSCSWLIGETLQRAPGVAEAQINFLQREAQVRYDPAQTEPGELVKRVRRLGYRAWLPGEKAYDDEEAHWNRLMASGVLVMHVMLFSFFIYGRDWLGLSGPDTEWLVTFFNLLSLIAATPVLLILGFPILRAGGASLLRGRPNTHTLIALGSFSAFGLSLYNLANGSGRVYFDTAAVLLFLMAIGRWLEMQAQKSGAEAVEQLFQKLPATATVLGPTGARTLSLDQVKVGMRVRVRPGDRFPVDGVVAVGQGDVDESLLTGEPDPVTRQPGDWVLTGTYNLDGAFEVIASAVGGETVAGQVGRLLHQALWQRAPVERLADRLAGWMTPMALILAGLTFGFWSFSADLETGLVYALSVLLIACPCALGIATPLTLWLGLGRAAQAGVILRRTGVLEALSQVDTFFFDKTGTLSQRPIRLLQVVVDPDNQTVDEASLRAWAKALEAQSEHPVGQAIAAGIELSLAQAGSDSVTDFRALPGQGIGGRVDGVPLWIGSRQLMQKMALHLPSTLAETAGRWQAQGLTVVYVGWQGRVMGLLGLGELMRPEASATLTELERLGVEVTVLTGDDVIAGLRWQSLLGVPVLAEQMPQDKLRRLQQAGSHVAMVGDGINDGPALAQATVGIAVSTGADVARAAADVVLLNPDLRAIPWLVSLSRLTMGKVRQNLIWASVYNLVGLGLAVTGNLQPALAALFMVLSSVVVITNALRLRKAWIGPLSPLFEVPAFERELTSAPPHSSTVIHQPQPTA